MTMIMTLTITMKLWWSTQCTNEEVNNDNDIAMVNLMYKCRGKQWQWQLQWYCDGQLNVQMQR